MSGVIALLVALVSAIRKARSERQEERARTVGVRGFVHAHGGITIYVFKVARAISTLALLALYIVDAVRQQNLLNLLLCITYVRIPSRHHARIQSELIHSFTRLGLLSSPLLLMRH